MKNYTTAEIARIMNVHPNTAILYEKWGYIEEVKRKPNGYRIFTEKHLEQMKLARTLLKGDIIKIEFRIRSIDIINTVVNGDLRLALSKAKDYLYYVEGEISNDSMIIKKNLMELKNIELQSCGCIYKTNEIAKRVDVTNDVLIYWERNGLLNVRRNKSNNYRVYSENDLILAKFIKPLRDLNYIVSSIYRLINTIQFSNNRTLKEIIYDLNLDYE